MIEIKYFHDFGNDQCVNAFSYVSNEKCFTYLIKMERAHPAATTQYLSKERTQELISFLQASLEQEGD